MGFAGLSDALVLTGAACTGAGEDGLTEATDGSRARAGHQQTPC